MDRRPESDAGKSEDSLRVFFWLGVRGSAACELPPNYGGGGIAFGQGGCGDIALTHSRD